jgi:hypothetical protein
MRADEVDDMALDEMIHDMMTNGRPSPFLLDFVKMLRRKRKQE